MEVVGKVKMFAGKVTSAATFPPGAPVKAAASLTSDAATPSLRYFRIDVEQQKLVLRQIILYSFSLWLLLGLLLWWWATEVPRAPVPLLQSYIFASRVHAAARISRASPAFAPAASTLAAAAEAAAAAKAEAEAAAASARGGAAATQEVAAAKAAASAAAALAAAALQRSSLTVRPLSASSSSSFARHVSTAGNKEGGTAAAFPAARTLGANLAAKVNSEATHITPIGEGEEKAMQQDEKKAELTNIVNPSSPFLLPPLTLVFGLRLLPLCADAANDAILFFQLLLARSNKAKLPLHRSLFSVDEGRAREQPVAPQQQQPQRGKRHQRTFPRQQNWQKGGGEERSDSSVSVEAAFTVALDVLFDGAEEHADGEATAAGEGGGDAAGGEGKEEERAAKEGVQRMLLQQAASLALLRVELLQPLTSACAAGDVPTAAAPTVASCAKSAAIPSAAASPSFPAWPQAAAAIALESEAALVYTVAFSAAPMSLQQQQQPLHPDAAERHGKKKEQQPQQQQRTKEEQHNTDVEVPPPAIVLHADSAATVYSHLLPSTPRVGGAAASPSSSRSDKAAAASVPRAFPPTAPFSPPSSPAASSSFALQEGAGALFHLLRTTVFRTHTPSAADAAIPGQYELSFWLAGDAPPLYLDRQDPPQQKEGRERRPQEREDVQQQQQQQQQGQQQAQPSQSSLLRQRKRDWTRLRWNFKKDVLLPYLQPFFSRASLLFTFPTIQSQVVPLSGIASLLKKAPDNLLPLSANLFPGSGFASPFPGQQLPAAAVAPAAAAVPAVVAPAAAVVGTWASVPASDAGASATATASPAAASTVSKDDLYVLDVASQHQLHAVSSRWQPQQIISIPTYFPAPLLNFVYYKPPVPTVIVQEMHAKPAAAATVTSTATREKAAAAAAITTAATVGKAGATANKGVPLHSGGAAAAAGKAKDLLATYGVSIPSWGALVIGTPPTGATPARAASVPACSAAAPPEAPALSISGAGATPRAAHFASAAPPPPAAAPPHPAAAAHLSPGAAARLPPAADALPLRCDAGLGSATDAAAAAAESAGCLSAEELRYATGMWIAQLRSIFLLPATLQDYFSLPDAAAAAAVAAATGAVGERKKRATTELAAEGIEEEEEEEGEQERKEGASTAASTGLLGEGWTAEVLGDGASSSSRGDVLLLRMLQRRTTPCAAGKREAAAAGAAGGRERAASVAAGKGRRGLIKRRRRRAEVRAYVELAEAGMGLWEVWGVVRLVYVRFTLQALKNISTLQAIIDSQPELVVLPHISKALQRALLLLECSAEAAVQHRICAKLPAFLRGMLLASPPPSAAAVAPARLTSRAFSPAAAAAAIRERGGGIMADIEEEQSLSEGNVSNARFFFFALALARAALQDSLEALFDESVAAKSHFGFEFKCAVYLPFSLPFLVPVVVGLLKLRKQSRKLATIAESFNFM